MTLKDRFEDKVSIEPNSGCWLWTGSLNDTGYGQLWVGSKSTRAHRLSYELHVGPIPEGMHVCHHCDNPPCCNPNHLFVGSHTDNMADKIKKGRGVNPIATLNTTKTHCPSGHPYEGGNLYVCTRGVRNCKECRRQAAVNRRARQHTAHYDVEGGEG
jgi:hypothetical protein